MIWEKSFLQKWCIAFILLILLDMIWFSFSFKKLYEPQFKKIQKQVLMRIWSAIFVWLLLGFLVSFVIRQTSCDPMNCGYNGMMMGFIVYGVYNFTNYATLVHYNLNVAIVDSIWGAFVIGFVSFLVSFLFSMKK